MTKNLYIIVKTASCKSRHRWGWLVEQNGIGYQDSERETQLPVFVHLRMWPSAHSPQECWNISELSFVRYIPLKLTLVRNEAIVVLWITTFLDQDVDLLSLQFLSWNSKIFVNISLSVRPWLEPASAGQLLESQERWPCQSQRYLTERQENVLQLSEHHGAVLQLVVEFQAFNEVLEGAGVLGVLHLFVNWIKLQSERGD